MQGITRGGGSIAGRPIRFAVAGCGRIRGKHFGALQTHGDHAGVVAVRG